MSIGQLARCMNSGSCCAPKIVFSITLEGERNKQEHGSKSSLPRTLKNDGTETFVNRAAVPDLVTH